MRFQFNPTTGKLDLTGDGATLPIDLSTSVTGRLPLTNVVQGVALSVLGVAGNATADHADIAATSDNQVLRRSGIAIAFGAINLAAAAAVTGRLAYTNFVAATAASKILGRTDASAGDWQEVTLGTNLTMSGTTLNASSGTNNPAGAAGDIQFYDTAAFGAEAALNWNKTTDTLSVDGAAVFNDSGADKDFRIEGDTDTSLFMVDASTDRVGIGTTTPQAKFAILNPASAANNLAFLINQQDTDVDIMEVQLAGTRVALLSYTGTDAGQFLLYEGGVVKTKLNARPLSANVPCFISQGSLVIGATNHPSLPSGPLFSVVGGAASDAAIAIHDNAGGNPTFYYKSDRDNSATYRGANNFLYARAKDDATGVTRATNWAFGALQGSSSGKIKGRFTFTVASDDTGANLDAMVIDFTGFVGLGTSSPASKIHLVAASDGLGTAITLGTFAVANGYLNTPASLYINCDSGNAGTGEAIYFGTNRVGNSGGTTLMKISDNGRVGIGTVSPAATLDVNGAAILGSSLGIGTTPVTSAAILISTPTLTGTDQIGVQADPIAVAAATGSMADLYAQIRTAAVSFTMVNGYGLQVNTPSVGATSAITNNYAIRVESQSGATNNYGVFFANAPNKGSIASGSGININFLAGGNYGFGVSAFGSSAVGALGIGTGTEPGSSPADMVQLYSVDLSAANATLGLRVETAVVSELVVSDSTLTIRINGVSYKLLMRAA